MKRSGVNTQAAAGTPSSAGQTPARVGADGGAGGPAAPKLRGTCDACATSKVKCPKEKPTCSRCKTRGLVCEYFVTRRPGRRREGSTSHTINKAAGKHITSSTDGRTSTNSERHSQPSSILSLNNDHSSDAHVGSSDNGVEDSDHETIQVVPDLLSEDSASADPASPTTGSINEGNDGLETPSMSISTYTELDNMSAIDSVLQGDPSFKDMMFFEHTLDDFDFVMPDIDPISFELDEMVGSPSSSQVRTDTASILMQVPPEKMGAILPPAAPFSAESSHSTSSTCSPLAASAQTSLLDKGKGVATSARGCRRTCGCLEEALALLRILSSSSTGSSLSSGLSSRGTVLGAPPEPGNNRPQDAVLRENQQAIDAITGMLASCPACAADTFFLTVVSMVVLKILARYAAAARMPPSAQHPYAAGALTTAKASSANRLVSSILLRGQDQAQAGALAARRGDDGGRERTAAQLVLGELHRVQRLVNQLSPRLKRNSSLGSDVDLLGRRGGGGGVVRGPAAWRGAVDVTWAGLGVFSGETESTCFSDNTLDQIERDVRCSLAALSAEIIKRLRQH